MNSLRTAAAWLRRHIGWSNSRQSWYERLGMLALVMLAASGWWWTRDLGPASRLVLLAGWLLLLALLLRRGLIKLFGPIFFVELLRGSRRRVHVTRVLYVLILLLAIGYVHLLRTEFTRGRPVDDLKAQAEIAYTAFIVYFCIQMAVVAFLTPVMVAGCIAEEKERRTLEFVLATDLRSREIVWGKLAGRLANLALLVIAGLPVLSFLQFLGGIPPDLLLASALVTGLTMMSTAAVSLWHSVMLKRSRDAIMLTFVAVLGYLVLSGCAFWLLEWRAFANGYVTLGGWTIDGRDLVEAFGAGNPFVHFATIMKRMFHVDTFLDVVPEILKEYAIFHGTVALVGVVWATLRLRPVALFQSVGETQRRRRGRRLPAIGRSPMIWKELFVDSGMRLPWVLKIPLILIVLSAFVPPVVITAEHADDLLADIHATPYPTYARYGYHERDAWDRYGRSMNVWVRGMTGTVGTLLLLAIAARAAGSVSGERSRQTLDELLTSPLSNREIVGAKWMGSILSVRFGWLWLGAVCFIGLLTGGLNLLGVALTVFAWLAYASLMATIGLWCSVVNRGTFRATLSALLVAMLLMFGHWVVTGLACFLPLSLESYSPGRNAVIEWLAAIELGFTPPFVLSMAPIHGMQEVEEMREEGIKHVVFAFVGCLMYLGTSAAINRLLVRRFGHVFNRTDLRRPDRKAPTAPVAETSIS